MFEAWKEELVIKHFMDKKMSAKNSIGVDEAEGKIHISSLEFDTSREGRTGSVEEESDFEKFKKESSVNAEESDSREVEKDDNTVQDLSQENNIGEESVVVEDVYRKNDCIETVVELERGQGTVGHVNTCHQENGINSREEVHEMQDNRDTEERRRKQMEEKHILQNLDRKINNAKKVLQQKEEKERKLDVKITKLTKELEIIQSSVKEATSLKILTLQDLLTLEFKGESKNNYFPTLLVSFL